MRRDVSFVVDTHPAFAAKQGETMQGEIMQCFRKVKSSRPQANHWRVALPALVLTAASLAGCAQTAANTGTAANMPGFQHSVVQFNSCAKPNYPADAAAANIQGTVTLRFMVETNGQASASEVVTSSGNTSLDEAARLAIAKCTFTPGTLNGKPQRGWTQVRYVWSIS